MGETYQSLSAWEEPQPVTGFRSGSRAARRMLVERADRKLVPVAQEWRGGDAGAILDTAFEILLARFGFFVSSATLLYLLVSALEGVLPFSDIEVEGLETFQNASGMLLYSLTRSLTTGLVVVGVYGELLGHRVAPGQMLLMALRRLPALAALSLMTFLVLCFSFFLALAPALFSPACAVLVLPGLLLVWVATWLLSLAPAVLLLEKRGVFASIARGARLARGSFLRWSVLYMLLSLFLIPLEVWTAFEAELVQAGHERLMLDSSIVSVLATLITAVCQGVSAALSGVVIAVFYLDTRVRREGFDLVMRLERIKITRRRWAQRSTGLVERANPEGPLLGSRS